VEGGKAETKKRINKERKCRFFYPPSRGGEQHPLPTKKTRLEKQNREKKRERETTLL
jgi:hypothetical protein